MLPLYGKEEDRGTGTKNRCVPGFSANGFALLAKIAYKFLVPHLVWVPPKVCLGPLGDQLGFGLRVLGEVAAPCSAGRAGVVENDPRNPGPVYPVVCCMVLQSYRIQECPGRLLCAGSSSCLEVQKAAQAVARKGFSSAHFRFNWAGLGSDVRPVKHGGFGPE